MKNSKRDKIYTRIKERAYELAKTGQYSDYRFVEIALTNEGYREARNVLDDELFRNELDRICEMYVSRK